MKDTSEPLAMNNHNGVWVPNGSFRPPEELLQEVGKMEDELVADGTTELTVMFTGQVDNPPEKMSLSPIWGKDSRGLDRIMQYRVSLKRDNSETVLANRD